MKVILTPGTSIDLDEDLRRLKKIRKTHPELVPKTRLSLVEIANQISGFCKKGKNYKPINDDWKNYVYADEFLLRHWGDFGNICKESYDNEDRIAKEHLRRRDRIYQCNSGYRLMLFEQLVERFKNRDAWEIVISTSSPDKMEEKSADEPEEKTIWISQSLKIRSETKPFLEFSKLRKFGYWETAPVPIQGMDLVSCSGWSSGGKENFDIHVYSFSVKTAKGILLVPPNPERLFYLKEDEYPWFYWINDITKPLFYELFNRLNSRNQIFSLLPEKK